MGKYQNIFANILFSVCLLIGSSVTLVYCLLVFMYLGFRYYNPAGLLNIELNLFIAGSGFGLYSFWWLLLKFDKINISQIPLVIKSGLTVGTIASFYYFFRENIAYVLENEVAVGKLITISPLFPPVAVVFLLVFMLLLPKK